MCSLCKQAGRPRFQHYLSQRKYLPEVDNQFFRSKVCIANQYLIVVAHHTVILLLWHCDLSVDSYPSWFSLAIRF